MKEAKDKAKELVIKETCKYFIKSNGGIIGFCGFLGNGLMCLKVCNMYVESNFNQTKKHQMNSKER